MPIEPKLEVKRHRLTKAERTQLVLSKELKEISVGLLLGDLYGEKQKTSINIRFVFNQGIIHKDYLFHLFELFQDYCPSDPKIGNHLSDKITGKVHSSIRFSTYSLPCFNEYYDLFYPNGIKKKVVPLNIGALLTPLGLAYWICDDGNNDRGAVRLCTNCFTHDEVKLLVSVLTDKINLRCSINKAGNGFIIRISQKSLPVLLALLKT